MLTTTLPPSQSLYVFMSIVNFVLQEFKMAKVALVDIELIRLQEILMVYCMKEEAASVCRSSFPLCQQKFAWFGFASVVLQSL